jgi:hypothetical protein
VQTGIEPPKPINLREQIVATIDGLRRDVESRIEHWVDVRSAIGFREFEVEIAALMRKVSDEIAASVVKQIVANADLVKRATAACRKALVMRGNGLRKVNITLLGGGRVEEGAVHERGHTSSKMGDVT